MNELNFNYNQCVKEINNIGSTTYQNICNGTLTTVPWGTANYLSSFFMGLIVLVVVVLMIGLVIMIKDIHDQ